MTVVPPVNLGRRLHGLVGDFDNGDFDNSGLANGGLADVTGHGIAAAGHDGKRDKKGNPEFHLSGSQQGWRRAGPMWKRGGSRFLIPPSPGCGQQIRQSAAASSCFAPSFEACRDNDGATFDTDALNMQSGFAAD
jgi:hypothetical protein